MDLSGMSSQGIGDAQLASFIEQENQKQRFQTVVHSLTEQCWELCGPSISSRLDGKSETCLANCVERFIDSSNFIINKLGQEGAAAVSSMKSNEFSTSTDFSLGAPDMGLQTPEFSTSFSSSNSQQQDKKSFVFRLEEMVESIIGIRGKDFVLLAQDANTTKYGILNMKFDTNRLFKLSEHCAMLAAGEPGDVVQFAEYVGKNIQLYKMINGIELSPYACANFTRHEMATSLRSRNSFLANLVVGGYSTNERDKERAQLYSIDYLGAMVSANVVAHGFCQFFALGIGDRLWKEDLSVEEALKMLQIIVNELGKRMAAYPHCVFVRIIDAQGIRVLDNMYPEKIHVAKPIEAELQTSADMMDIHT